MPVTLKELMELQINFDKQHCGLKPFFESFDANNLEELEHLIVCILGELGEYANLVKKIRRGDFAFSDKKKELNQELADIFIYLIKLANQMDVDLEAEYLEKLEANWKRFKQYELK